ncbi:MAG: hypothetical protein U5L45_11585 [Saprospiraceae bacterium]|nr:hypothetical protein [Saprospiraceae bacterium]
MKKLFSPILTIIALTLALSSCDKETVVAPLTIPTTYESANFATTAATQIGVGKRVVSITNEAKKGRKATAKVSADSLNYWFTTGSPNLKTINTAYLTGRFEGATGWFAEIAKASGTTYTPSATITGNGGAFGGYLFDENGLEIEQLIEKGQFGSVLYNHATTLLSSKITAETVDQVVAIFGANPTFPNTPTASKTAQPDLYMSNYAARRDKNDGKGLYTQMKNAFLKLQAAVKAGSDYDKDRDAAVADVKLTWEKVNAATIINYCHAVITTMSQTTTTDAQKGSALHAYGECVGFTHGWRTISASQKKITDAQIDEVLDLLNAPATGTPTSYKFVTEPVTQLPKLTQIITKLKGIYGFTDAEIEDFKSNWVSVQGR